MYYMSKLRHDPEVDKVAFEAWQSEGTIKRAYQKLMKDGIISSRGRPFSPDGVRKSAVRYMVYHYDDSKKLLMETYEKTGYAVEEEYIERLLIKMAVSALRNRWRIKGWLIEHELLERHKKFIGSLVAIPHD